MIAKNGKQLGNSLGQEVVEHEPIGGTNQVLPDVSSLTDKSIKVRFYFKNSELYAFPFPTISASDAEPILGEPIGT